MDGKDDEQGGDGDEAGPHAEVAEPIAAVADYLKDELDCDRGDGEG